MRTNLCHLIQTAYDHIVTAHILEPQDSHAAFECERQAWDVAYTVGLRSAAGATLPALFTISRTLTQAWSKARADRSSST